jgi:hypothetical protein
LSEWLNTLSATIADDRFAAAEVGLTRWLVSASRLLDGERASAMANRAQIAARDELRGRLLARRAQARALATRGRPVDPSLDEVALEAEALLRERPTPVERAARR